MKLAEALIERQALESKIARLRERLLANARVRAGDLPFESPAVLFKRLADTAVVLERLEVRIYRTRVTAALPESPGVPLARVAARRDTLALRLATLEDLLRVATDPGSPPAAGRPDIRLEPSVDVPALQDQIEALLADIRALETRLQAAEWAVDLVE